MSKITKKLLCVAKTGQQEKVSHCLRAFPLWREVSSFFRWWGRRSSKCLNSPKGVSETKLLQAAVGTWGVSEKLCSLTTKWERKNICFVFVVCLNEICHTAFSKTFFFRMRKLAQTEVRVRRRIIRKSSPRMFCLRGKKHYYNAPVHVAIVEKGKLLTRHVFDLIQSIFWGFKLNQTKNGSVCRKLVEKLNSLARYLVNNCVIAVIWSDWEHKRDTSLFIDFHFETLEN